MKERYEIKLAGVEGQGIVLAGLVLGEAAIRDGKNAMHTQSYVPEDGSGACVSEIIISEQEVSYPRVLQADLLLALAQDAYDKQARNLADDGLLIADQSVQTNIESAICYSLPLISVSAGATGNGSGAAMVALGIIAGLTKVVSREAILAATEMRAPRDNVYSSRAAVMAGLRYAETMSPRPFPWRREASTTPRVSLGEHLAIPVVASIGA